MTYKSRLPLTEIMAYIRSSEPEGVRPYALATVFAQKCPDELLLALETNGFLLYEDWDGRVHVFDGGE
jgi:hypothetical protein